MGENGISLSLYKGGTEFVPPHLPLKISYFPGASVNGVGWVTHTCINGDPAIRGHDLCFDRTCQRNRLAMCAGAGCKNGLNKLPSHGVMSHNEELSTDQIRGLLFSLR